MWRIKKKTETTLISQPDVQLVVVQSGPGRSQPAKNFIPGKRDTASAPGVGWLLCISDTPCFQGALRLIQCHSHKGGRREPDNVFAKVTLQAGRTQHRREVDTG